MVHAFQLSRISGRPVKPTVKKPELSKGTGMIRPLLLATVLLASPVLAASPIEGNWTNPSHSVTVRIAPCRVKMLCGRVIRASAPAKAKAAAAGTPKLIGAELMSDLRPVAEGAWRGTFFVPDRNVRADGELHLLSARTLEIKGCAMSGLLCKSQRWTRLGGAAKARRHQSLPGPRLR